MPVATSYATASRPQRALSGRTAIVTGSTSGIGLGIAGALAERGANVVLNGFGQSGKICNLSSRLMDEHGVEVLYSGADMSRPDRIQEMVTAAVDQFGQVDILVNNAGIQYVAALEDFPVEKWNAILAINLSAAFHTTRAVIADMKTRHWGRIVNVASAHGLIASPFKAAYVAAKHGVLGLTKVTALEAAESGVTCNAVCPGYVWTPLVEKQIEDQARAHGIPRDEVIRDVLLKQQPNRRFATIEEIGAFVAFLCLPEAQSITGAALPIDGGWTAH